MPNAEHKFTEEDFIHEGYSKNPFPARLWLGLIAIMLALIWGGKSYFSSFNENGLNAPFNAVTNRQFSLFLWQNPEYMRVNVSSKLSYLEGFQYNQKVTVEPQLADKQVQAPPKVVFLYHVWNRLLGDEYIPRRITPDEFRNFLKYCAEWDPAYWPEAPAEYIALVKDLPKIETGNLNDLPESKLPRVVKKAFVGWKNYTMEGDTIDHVRPTYEELQQFLMIYPHYARNFWRNIQGGSTSKYLAAFLTGEFNPKDVVPDNELAAFLKVAFYNYKTSEVKK